MVIQWRAYSMKIPNWVEILEEKLIKKGMSLKTDVSLLGKGNNRIFFNEIIRDILEEYPNKRLQHIILSLKDYYEVEDIYLLLDEQNKHRLMKDYEEEDNIKISLKRRKH